MDGWGGQQHKFMNAEFRGQRALLPHPLRVIHTLPSVLPPLALVCVLCDVSDIPYNIGTYMKHTPTVPPLYRPSRDAS